MIDRTRERDRDVEQAEFNALSTLRQRYKMRDAGSGKYDAFCPAHDDRHGKSLRVYRCDDGRLRFRCYAGCSFNDVRAALGLPTFHGLSRNGYATDWRPPPAAPKPKSTRYDFPALADHFAADGPTLSPLAKELGVSVAALLDADVGRADGYPMYVRKRDATMPVHAWSFPMVDESATVVGLRMRGLAPGKDGTVAKYSWTDSTPGLFVGRRWTGAGPVFVCEGPTDRAAAFDWGFDAIAKPSCNDGDELVAAMLRAIRKIGQRRDVVIFSQLDEAKPKPGGGVFYPGQDGADALAARAVYFADSLRIITPPPGAGKDARSWLRAGGTRADVDRMIDSKRPYRIHRSAK